MRRTKRLMLVGVASTSLAVGLFTFFNGKGHANQQGAPTANQADAGRAAKQLDDAARPVVDFDNPDAVEPAKVKARKLKNARYDRQGAVQRHPDPNTGEVIAEPEWQAGLSDLPADRSDVVVEGIVAGSKAFLSEDKTGVYSEFTIVVSRVLKADPKVSLSLGDTIVAERFGGRIRYPSGQAIVYRIEGQGAPITGKRYLFFLTSADQDNYRLLTAYEIQGQTVFALDGSRTNSRGKGHWVFDKHNGEDLESFMGKAEKAINNSKRGGNQP